MGIVARALNLAPARPNVNFQPSGYSFGSGYGSTQYTQLARLASTNDLVGAAIELISTSAAEPAIIGHRMRRASPTPRIAMRDARRRQALYGRKNRPGAMMGDRHLILNGFMEEVPDHPLIRILNNPNPYISSGQFWGQVVRDLLICGDAFIYKARYTDGILKSGVAELWRLRPDRVKPDVSSTGELTGWIYTVGNESRTFPIADVMHVKKGQHPTNDHLGWGPLMTLVERVRIDNDQRNFLAAFYETGGTGPAAILSAKGKMAQSDKDTLRDQNRRQYGPGNFLNLMILDQAENVTYTPLSLNRGLRDALPVDVNSIQETRIAAAFGIPGSILGLLVAYANGAYASRKIDWQTLWDITMTPLLSSIDDEIDRSLVSEFAGIDEACFDLSDIRALQEDMFALHDNARKNVDAGIWTIERGRLETGEPAEAPDGEHTLLPTRSTITAWPLPDAPENPPPLAPKPGQAPSPAMLIEAGIRMLLPERTEERGPGRPRIEEDPGARQVYDEAMQLRGANPGMTWQQIAARVGVVERTLRNYRNTFDED